MDGMDLSELLGVFLEEADEQLQQLDDGFLQLEKDPSNMDTVREVFRAAHTLKGSSATMGFTEIAELTHAMESLLDGVRNETVAADSHIIDLLLSANDALRKLIEQVRNNESLHVEDETLAARLKAAAGLDGEDPAAPPARVNRYDPVEEGMVRLIVEISPECLMPSVRAFMVHNSLSAIGEVVSAVPSADQIDSVAAGQRIVLNVRTSAETEAVMDVIHGLAEVELVDVVLPSDDPAPPPSVAKPAAAPEAAEQPGKAIQTVRVGVERLDTLMNLVAELVIDRTRIAQIESRMSLELANEDLVQDLGETSAHIGRVVAELQEHIMKVRLLPVEQVFNRFPRMVRDLAHGAGKSVEFVMEGQDTELDRSILEHIVDPITHLLRNAVDHGIERPEERKAAGKRETARVTLAAKQEENRIIIVEDDGRGIDVENVKRAAVEKGAVTPDLLSRMSESDCLQLIFASGVSTAEKVTDVSGRGVGMDVVRSSIQGLSGTVDVITEVGSGTQFKINLPLTLAIIQALVTGVDDKVYVIPLSAVVETFRCDEADVRYLNGKPAIHFRGSVLPLIKLNSLFGRGSEADSAIEGSATFVVVNTGTLKIGLVVDRLIGEQEVVIKPLGSFFGNLRGVAGATILGDGRVAVIVDVAGIGGLVNTRRYDRGSLQALGV